MLVGSLFFVSAVADWSSAWAQEAWVTALYQPVPGGYRYHLTVYNNTDPAWNGHIVDLLLWIEPVPARDAASDVVSPAGWTGYVDVWQNVNWSIGMNNPEWWTGIPPGESLSGFAFTFSKLQTAIPYSAGVRNIYGYPAYGGTIIPELIPEPSSLLALATGLAGALSSLRKRRRK